MSKCIAAVVSKMVSELEGLKSDEERERAFAGARAVLGMPNLTNRPQAGRGQGGSESPEVEGAELDGISSAGMAWIKRNGLKKETIDEFFHVEDGKVTLVGEAIGKGKREQAINTYLLTG